MNEELKKYYGHNCSDLWIYLEDGGQPVSGVMLTPCIDIPVPFQGLADLLLKANSIFDVIECPQRYMMRRTMSGEPAGLPAWIWEHVQNPLCTEIMELSLARRHRGGTLRFFVRVHSRQNASWQGEVTCVGTQYRASFRSALELMEMMDDILTTEQRDAADWSSIPVHTLLGNVAP